MFQNRPYTLSEQMASASKERLTSWLSTQDLSDFRKPAPKLATAYSCSFRDRVAELELGGSYISGTVSTAPRYYMGGGGRLDHDKTKELKWKYSFTEQVRILLKSVWI